MLFCSALFALLVANLTMIMVVQADYYQGMPGNNHSLAKEARTERGTISTYDGVVLAQSVPTEDGTFERVYPAGDLASQVVGYSSARFGTSGIEQAYNDTLKGKENFASWTDVLNSFAGIGGAGNDVALTLNSKIQQAAQDALSGETGACVVMDPDTGPFSPWLRRPPTTQPTLKRSSNRPTPTPPTRGSSTAPSMRCTRPARRSRSCRWPPRSRTAWPTRTPH